MSNKSVSFEQMKNECDFYELEIPFEHKDIAKANKCFFNDEAKRWCIHSKNKKHDEMVNLYERIYLKNEFENKEIYKQNGARWNNETKEWYTYKSNDNLKEYFDE